mmetsp:Transcript_25361/g.51667  ORF Transcript_25361/g.51667 Transcript_25361/m.51667 type:complete len:285 (-) Transcript_25361:1364-2218(-)
MESGRMGSGADSASSTTQMGPTTKGGEINDLVSWADNGDRLVDQVKKVLLSYISELKVLYATPAEDSAVKLCDFGLGKIVNVSDLDAGRCRLWSRCGSPDYVAPEVLKRQGYGKECDVWSAGAILCVLLCGHPPFNQASVTSKFEHIRKGCYSFTSSTWDTVSAEAKDLICKILCVDSKQRLGYAEILDHAWIRQYLEGQLSEEAMAATQERLREWTLSRKVRTTETIGNHHLLTRTIGASIPMTCRQRWLLSGRAATASRPRRCSNAWTCCSGPSSASQSSAS